MNAREFGRYTLIKKLAAGGMAEVFLARQQGLEGFEKLLVIKRILPHLADDAEFVQMFLNEARIAARFNHPNICQIYDLGKIDETYFIAMEFVHGEDMGRVMRKCWTKGHWIPQPLALLVIARVCEALHYAHSKTDENGNPLRVIHRDISPQNILVSFDGAVKLVDFGIARAADSSATTRAGALKGKFAYMAPEQAQNKPVDHRADLFAAGLVLYEFLTGVRPFKRDSDLATLQAVMECDIRPPSEIAKEVPADLDAVTMKALTRVADDRYPDGRAFQMAIEEFLFRKQWVASSVHLSEFMRALFADRLAQEKELGRPDPSTAESASGNLPPPRDGSLPPLIDSGLVLSVPHIERPSSPTLRAQGPVGPPGAQFDSGPRIAPGGTAMNKMRADDEPTLLPPPPAPPGGLTTPARVPQVSARNESSPGSNTGKRVVEETRVARTTGEQPRAPSGPWPKNEYADWEAPPGVPEKRVAAAETALNPVPQQDSEDGGAEDTEATAEPTESSAGATAAIRPPSRKSVPRGGPSESVSGNGARSGPLPRRPTDPGSRSVSLRSSTSGSAARPPTPAPKRISAPRPITAERPKVYVEDEPSISGISEVAEQSISEISQVAEASVSGFSEVSASKSRWRPDKKAVAMAIVLGGAGLGILVFSPQIATWLQHNSSQMKVGESAFITVQSDPPGLDAFVNGRELGKTPVLRASIPANETLSIKLASDPRGIHWETTRRASAGEEIKVSPSFALGKVIVRLAERRAARIFIGNQLVGLCDGLADRCAQIDHPAGNYHLRLEDDSSGEMMRGDVEVRISPNRTTETAPVKMHVVKETAASNGTE